jgi:hypothetical protein
MNKAAIAILIVLCACSSDPEMDPDEPMPDAAAPNPPNHQVEVYDQATGLPQAEVFVVVHRADGAMRSLTTTNAAGLASVFVEAGDGITVGRPDYVELLTILAVSPGGRSRFARSGSTSSEGGVLTMNRPACAAASFYATAGPGSYVTTLGTLAVASDHLGRSSRLSVFAWCNGTGYSMVRDVPMPSPAGGTVDLPAWTTAYRTIQLGAPGNQSYPAGVSSLNVAYDPIVDGVSLPVGWTFLAPGTATLTLAQVPDVAVDGFAEMIEVYYERPFASSQSRRFRAAADTTGTLDVTATLAPRWVASKTTDPNLRHTITLEPSASAAGADVLGVEIGGWYLLMPPDRTEIRLPQLPESFRRLLPVTPESVRTRIVDLSDVAGYDAYLATDVVWQRFITTAPTAERSLRLGSAFNQ